MKNAANSAGVKVYNKALILGVRMYLYLKGVKFPFIPVMRNAP